MHTYFSLSLIAVTLLTTIIGAVPSTALTPRAIKTASFHDNAQHIIDYRPVARKSTLNSFVIWSYETGDWVESSPTIVDGIVYVGSDDFNVYALCAANGTKIWNYTTGYYVDSFPVVSNGIIYMGSNDCNVHALGQA